MNPIDRKYHIQATNFTNGKKYDETNSLLLCAKDKAVPATLTAYRNECIKLGSNKEHIESIDLLIGRVIEYQNTIENHVPDTLGDEIPRCLNETNTTLIHSQPQKTVFAKALQMGIFGGYIGIVFFVLLIWFAPMMGFRMVLETHLLVYMIFWVSLAAYIRLKMVNHKN